MSREASIMRADNRLRHLLMAEKFSSHSRRVVFQLTARDGFPLRESTPPLPERGLIVAPSVSHERCAESESVATYRQRLQSLGQYLTHVLINSAAGQPFPAKRVA